MPLSTIFQLYRGDMVMIYRIHRQFSVKGAI